VTNLYAKGWLSAIRINADRSGSGITLPRFSARFNSPLHAVELKEYLPNVNVCSSTCDNKHTLAPLGQSEVLSVKDSPRNASLGSNDNTSGWPLSIWRVDW
jgi:hypothetical protein